MRERRGAPKWQRRANLPGTVLGEGGWEGGELELTVHAHEYSQETFRAEDEIGDQNCREGAGQFREGFHFRGGEGLSQKAPEQRNSPLMRFSELSQDMEEKVIPRAIPVEWRG